jgi:simple sugar transport system ATP-binding protein
MENTTPTDTALIDMRNISIAFGGIRAVDDASIDLFPGEVVALLGHNGAGKSTLIKILSGVHRPEQGEILIDGRSTIIRTPKHAMRLGIETIYQYNAMVPMMSIARNVFIGREPIRFGLFGFGLLDQKRMREESVQAIADVELHLRSPDALVGELSGGQRQGVAIARAMHFKSKVMVLDEPTNHLSVKETNKVLGFIRGLRAQNVTGIFISHNIPHVFHSCDRIVAMARGEIVFDKPVGETSVDEVQELL